MLDRALDDAENVSQFKWAGGTRGNHLQASEGRSDHNDFGGAQMFEPLCWEQRPRLVTVRWTETFGRNFMHLFLLCLLALSAQLLGTFAMEVKLAGQRQIVASLFLEEVKCLVANQGHAPGFWIANRTKVPDFFPGAQHHLLHHISGVFLCGEVRHRKAEQLVLDGQYVLLKFVGAHPNAEFTNGLRLP